jgi:hypothetical protein
MTRLIGKERAARHCEVRYYLETTGDQEGMTVTTAMMMTMMMTTGLMPTVTMVWKTMVTMPTVDPCMSAARGGGGAFGVELRDALAHQGRTGQGRPTGPSRYKPWTKLAVRDPRPVPES